MEETRGRGGNYIFDPSLGGSCHELVVVIRRGQDGHGDDEVVLVFESIDDGFFVVIVDLGHLDAFGERAGAPYASEGGDGVFSCGEESFGDGLAYITTSLLGEILLVCGNEGR